MNACGMGQDDLTIRTALLEHRFLAGNQALCGRAGRAALDRAFRLKTGPDFVASKLEERVPPATARQGGSRYLVEPNVKEGKGGLRDLQTLFWIAKYLYRTPDTQADLVAKGRLQQAAELDNLPQRQRHFLWATRCQLHLISGPSDREDEFRRPGRDCPTAWASRMAPVSARSNASCRPISPMPASVGELTRIFLVALEARARKVSARAWPAP